MVLCIFFIGFIIEILLNTLLVGFLFSSAYGIFLPVKFLVLVLFMHGILLPLTTMLFDDDISIVRTIVVGIGVLTAVDLLSLYVLAKYIVGTVAIGFVVNILMYEFLKVSIKNKK